MKITKLNNRTMSFEDALSYLKDGSKICREGWNGKNMWLILINPSKFSKGTFSDQKYPLLPFIGMKTADDKFVPWLASQTDILAEDWILTSNS